ncbi:hypothetical protein K431DRAFT_287773 [Polychaeton citri CBS 116435]|uniref:Vegetatible incompatibility protein HET-E-1 n=1 Tax=Polychaeton citri CBS 116435 TaxID=1314669 RepID=A0A9P4Q1Y3_9PEZI|nr:hypothetical protein K431DRAFT_287773 [Polychaeton citri CBS 116435]
MGDAGLATVAYRQSTAMTDTVLSAYEARRLEKIKKNQALLAELDIKPINPKRLRGEDEDQKPEKATLKRRKIISQAAPTRTSARIASAPQPSYKDEPSLTPLPRNKAASSNPRPRSTAIEPPPVADSASLPKKAVDDIKSGWTSWEPTAAEPTRDSSGTFRFDDYPSFLPNKSPEEVLREGCFGGEYYRPLYSRKLGITVRDDWRELPSSWVSQLPIEKYLINQEYDRDINKYKVSCGQSIEEWEASGWIAHEHDVRGWFQWYTRFFRGRRCADDDRQVSRWRKCVGETGRWRRTLLKKYVQLGVRAVFDDGEDEDTPEVSPVVHQTCHHWAWEVRQDALDQYWAEVGR